MYFARRESIPAGCAFRDKFDFQPINKRRVPALQGFQAWIRVFCRVIALICQVEWFLAEVRVSCHYCAGTVATGQPERAGSHRVTGKHLPVFFHCIPGHNCSVSLCECMHQLREWPCQGDLHRVVIQCAQACDLDVIVRAFCFPKIQTFNPVLPYPRTLGAGIRIEMPFDGIDKIPGVYLSANAILEGRVVREIHVFFYPDGHR